MPFIDRPWEAFVTSIAEMVVRGTKSIGTLTIDDNFDNINPFMAALVADQPSFTKPLYYAIKKAPHDMYVVVLYSNQMAYDIYNKVQDIADKNVRDALRGFLFGYAADSIWAYLSANRPSK